MNIDEPFSTEPRLDRHFHSPPRLPPQRSSSSSSPPVSPPHGPPVVFRRAVEAGRPVTRSFRLLVFSIRNAALRAVPRANETGDD